MGKININLSNMKLQDIIKQLLVVVLISLYGCSDFLDPIMIAFQTITLIVLLIML